MITKQRIDYSWIMRRAGGYRRLGADKSKALIFAWADWKEKEAKKVSLIEKIKKARLAIAKGIQEQASSRENVYENISSLEEIQEVYTNHLYVNEF